MNKLRVAVIGAGHLGSIHANMYSSLRRTCGLTLVGVCDIRKSVAKEVADRNNTLFYTDHRELLDKVDAVSIVVPTTRHYEVAKDFLKAGVHVLIEKPITKTLEEADELIAIAKKKKLIIQVGHIERFNSAIRSIEPFIKKPKFIECQRLGSIQKKKRIKDVGVVLDLMIHDIDIILGLLRSKVKSIEAVGVSTVSRHEDMANVRLGFQSGAIADITASRVTKEETRKIRIFQEDSYILLDFLHQDAILFRKTETSLIKEKINIHKKNALQIELRSFVDCVRNGQKPLVSGQEGRQALEVALAILEKIKNNPASK
ncbi:MAG: Gfo/Idh/MocA family oxidoreductase [Candidatus Omnitrophica bacterium]|nr:Gfo/Idh/MocA family oxidoreductase [Candidatus Omnitrophota bacterium]MDD5488210.1 Gfo/Idh/MocA family oxidoreductase [Candidatus Omnitrophota bacterium]